MPRLTGKLTAALLAAASVAAVSSSIALADHGDGATRLVLTEVTTEAHAIDNAAPTQFDGTAPDPNKAGDVVTFTSDLHKGGTSGATAGSLEGFCTVVDAAGAIEDCDVDVKLKAGSYRMGGRFGATGGKLTILGGTGRYAGATGSDTIVNNPDGTATHTVRISAH